LKNVYPNFVQELLGHASVAIALDTYSHMLPGMGGEAAYAIGEVLGWIAYTCSHLMLDMGNRTVAATGRSVLGRTCTACRERCAGGGPVPVRNVILHLYPGGSQVVVSLRCPGGEIALSRLWGAVLSKIVDMEFREFTF
jgi:hypothetical protein